MTLKTEHPFVVFSKEIAELCKPLEAFHIRHFIYLKQFNDGGRICLSNNPQWVEDYYNLKLYESSLFEEKPSTYKPVFNVWIGDYDLDVYYHMRDHYKTTHTISITEPHHDGCEHYLFCADPTREQAIHYLSNNMDILYHFILYLKDRAEHLFHKAEKERIIVQKSFIDEAPSKPIYRKSFDDIMELHKKKFFDKTPIRSFAFQVGNAQGIKLTQREVSCVSYLLQNKTAQETADLMNISRRTVESYLENIKIKLDCDTKSELFAILRNNKYLVSIRGTDEIPELI